MNKILYFFQSFIHNLYLIYFKYKLSSKGVRFAKQSKISDNDTFEGNNYIDGHVINCFIGRGSYIMNDCWLSNCYIGRYCSIASEVKMIQKHGHPITYASSSPIFSASKAMVETYISNEQFLPYYGLDEKITYQNKDWDAVIGNDVWIGSRSILLGAITIGDGAIIGAGSIVTQSIPPYAIVAGNPAQIIKYRFPQETITQLLQTQWWNKEEDWLRKNASLFSDVNSLLSKLDTHTPH